MSLINIQAPAGTGKKYGRSLNELADTPEFRQYEEVTKRFPSSEYDVLAVIEGSKLLDRESIEKLKTPPVVPRGYAVVIGVSNYKNLSPNQNLLFAEKDAENFYSALISKEAGNMEFENVTTGAPSGPSRE